MPDRISLDKREVEVFLNSFIEIPIMFHGDLNFDDFKFDLSEGTAGHIVKKLKPLKGPGMEHSIRFLSTGKVGRYDITIWHKGDELGKIKVNVTNRWADDRIGPSSWTASSMAPPPHALSRSSAFRPISNIIPKRIKAAVVLVEPKGLSFQYDRPDDPGSEVDEATQWTAEKEKEFWRANINAGTTRSGVFPVPRSVRRFYIENSTAPKTTLPCWEDSGTLEILGEVFGSIQLPGELIDYFSTQHGGVAEQNGGSGHYPFFDDCFIKITEQHPDLMTGGYDTFIFVVRSTTPFFPWFVTYYDVGWTTGGSNGKGSIIQPVVLPDSYRLDCDNARYDNGRYLSTCRDAVDITSHEIGHVLGLRDFVDNNGYDKDEIMHYDCTLPSVSMANRMALGMVSNDWIKRLSLPVDGKEFGLDPLRSLRPVHATAYTGLVIDILEFLKVFIEYRAPPNQEQQISDVDAGKGAVMAFLYMDEDPDERTSRTLSLLRTELGPECILNKSGEKFDVTLLPDDYPLLNRAVAITIKREGWSKDLLPPYPGTVKLKVTVQASGPNPCITRWPGGMDWRSPDIAIRNERNRYDVRYANLPWIGHDNEVIATVHNSGPEDAPNVHVDFYATAPDLGTDVIPPEGDKIGEAIGSIQAGGSVKLQCIWHPETGDKSSIVVKIRDYYDSNNQPELSFADNMTRSNYIEMTARNKMETAQISAWITNRSSRDKVFRFRQFQSSDGCLTMVSTTRMVVGPGTNNILDLMVQDLEEPLRGLGVPRRDDRTNDVSLVAWEERAVGDGKVDLEMVGGVSARVFTGKETCFQKFSIDPQGIIFLAVVSEDGKPVDNGRVILTFRGALDQPERYQIVHLDGAGQGEAVAAYPSQKVEAYYLAPPGLLGCTKTIKR